MLTTHEGSPEAKVNLFVSCSNLVWRNKTFAIRADPQYAIYEKQTTD